MQLLADRLREERRRLGFNQSEMALRLGVGRSALGHYETGTSLPDAAFLAKTQEEGMDTWWVLTGTQHAEAAVDFANLDVMKAVVLAVSDFAKDRGLVLDPDKENALISILYKQFIQLGAADRQGIQEFLLKVAA